MITISDLNVSQESYLTELKDAEMMGDIVGGLNFVAAPRLQVTFPTNGTDPITFQFRLGTLRAFNNFFRAEFTLNI